MSFKHISPAMGYYVLEPVEVKQTGVFQVPEDKKPEIGRIVGVGGDLTHESGNGLIAPEYEIGDVVAYSPYTAKTLKLDGKELGLVKFVDVIGKLNEESN